MNKTVLITGATSGIGYEFSKIFAVKGFNLIITGRNEKKLKEMESELSGLYEIKVVSYGCDLCKKENVLSLFNYVKSLNFNIDILINNAGVGFNGEFHELPWEKHLQTLEINITSLTYLTHLVLGEMLKQGEGKILNVASTGAYQPGSYIGVYYATKAYVLSFSQALRQELKDKGIMVTALCPGSTKTQFSKRAGKGDLKVAMSAEKVAKLGYRGLMKNKAVVIPGLINKIMVAASKIAPSSINAKVVKEIQQKAMEKK